MASLPLNNQPMNQRIVRMGYMPVVTNLAAPLLDYVSRHGSGVHFEAVKFSSFAEMAEALRNDSIQAAFIIAPLAVVLRQQGVDVKVVLIGNRHESTLVARKTLNAKRLEDLSGRTIAVPMRYSGHNLCLLKMIEEKGLGGKIRVVEMNPPDMASALTSGALDAYFVGEPFAAQTVLSGDADVVDYVESLWPGFYLQSRACEKQLDRRQSVRCPKTGRDGGRSGSGPAAIPMRRPGSHPVTGTSPLKLVRHALTTPSGRVVYDRFVPKTAEIQTMADLMVRYDLDRQADITGLVDNRFALAASIDGIDDLDSILLPEASEARPSA
jgi:NitT/TauT family transport system substrate-binding protein